MKRMCIRAMTSLCLMIFLAPTAHADGAFQYDTNVLERLSALLGKYGPGETASIIMQKGNQGFTINLNGKLTRSPYSLAATDTSLVDKYSLSYDMFRYGVSIEAVEKEIQGRPTIRDKLLAQEKNVERQRKEEEGQSQAAAKRRVDADNRRVQQAAIANQSQSTSARTQVPVPIQVGDVRIVGVKDISIKAITRPLSTYTTADIQRLPVNVRKEYRIVVPSNMSKDGLQTAMIRLVEKETAKDKDIDEVVVFAYDRLEDSNGPYTFGKLEWCPNGDWGSMTPSIASRNDRSSYKYVVDIR